MKRFLYKAVLFGFCLISFLALALVFFHDKGTSTNLLAAIVDKHEVLKRMKGEKIVFAGGSNISFGLNSEQISRCLRKPVMNMGVHAGLGLKFIVNDVKPFLSKGDVLIIVPEYENFYSGNFYGEMELVSLLFDVCPSAKASVEMSQWGRIFKYVPAYAARKVKNVFLQGLGYGNETPLDIYHRHSFNAFGDAVKHWNLPNQPFLSLKKQAVQMVNGEVVDFLKETKKDLESKGVKVIILPPVIESESFGNLPGTIENISASLENAGISFCARPESYSYPKEYFFNTYYHLNKKGADKRTEQLITDLKRILAH